MHNKRNLKGITVAVGYGWQKFNESEHEELIRLRAENEYLRTELAVIKKLEALRKEKQAAQLKAKKQR